MPDPITYPPEEVVTDWNVIKAVWEQIKGNLDNKAQVAIAYATCRSLLALIEMKVKNLEPLNDGPIWPPGTSPGYFLEKITGAVDSLGELAEKILADSSDEKAVQKVWFDFAKVHLSVPNHAVRVNRRYLDWLG